MAAAAGRATLAAPLAALALAAGAPLAAADPAEDALSARDAYVSPRALGPAAPAAEAELQATADRLADRGQPARLAIVAGPAGAPSMLVYARRLAGEVAGEGETLVVTAPRRAVIAVGPRPPAEITRRLRANRVGSIADPVERAVRAAELAVPDPPDDEAWGTRAVLVLLGLAALGAAWAVAWAARRQARADRERMLEARAATAVRLDALAARAGALLERPGLPAAARAQAERAVAAHDEAAAGLRGARSAADVNRLAPAEREAAAALSRAAAAAGDEPPGDDPFAGLCAADPAHGPAVAEARIEGGEEPVAVCAACADEAAAGRPPRPRLVPIGGRPAPFTQVNAEPPDTPPPPGG